MVTEAAGWWGSDVARGGGGGGGALPLWVSVGMRRGFAPHFRHLDDLFAPPNFTMSTILFRSCWVPFRNPPFSACRRSFCPQNWPNLSFHSDLVGSHFELRAAHPDWFLPGVPPPGDVDGNEEAAEAHDDGVKLKHFPRYWPFVWGVHRSPVNSPHTGQWRGALMCSLFCASTNSWANETPEIWDAMALIMTSL